MPTEKQVGKFDALAGVPVRLSRNFPVLFREKGGTEQGGGLDPCKSNLFSISEIHPYLMLDP